MNCENCDHMKVIESLEHRLIAASKPSGASAGYTPEQVLKAVYESGLHQYAPKVIQKSWKDGIDIDVPSAALMNFVRKLQGV